MEVGQYPNWGCSANGKINSGLASQQIPRLICDPKIHYSLDNSVPEALYNIS
jgi:hypothetical protein